MKKIKILLQLICPCILFCCSVEDPEPISAFVKIIGEDQSSEGNKMILLENEDILVFGRTGTAAFDVTSFSSTGVIVGGDQDTAPSITHLDSEGNLISKHLYPLPSSLDLPGFDPVEDAVNSTFLDAIATSDGGYFILGVYQGIQLVRTSGDLEINSAIPIPFILKVNQDLILEYFQIILEQPNELFLLSPSLFELPNQNVGILFSVVGSRFGPVGYAIQEYSNDGNDLIRTKLNTLFGTFKLGNSLLFDSNGRMLLMGQEYGRIVIYELNPVTFDEINVTDLANDGQRLFNNNPMKIMELADGRILTIHSEAPQEVRFIYVDNVFSTTDIVDIEPQRIDDYYRDVLELTNGEILLSNVNILGEPINYLYRLDQFGNRIWRLEFEGYTGDIKETSDGSLLLLYNPFFNNQATKATLRKISRDGKF